MYTVSRKRYRKYPLGFLWIPPEIFLHVLSEKKESQLDFFKISFMSFSVRLSTEHLLGIQTHIKISTWRETGYTISTVLAMNFVVFAVYKLISWPVKSIWRRWWVEEGKNQRKLCLRYQNTPIDCRQLFRQTTSSTFLNRWALVSRLLTNFPHTLPSSVNFKRAIFHRFFALFTKTQQQVQSLASTFLVFF